MRVQRFIKASLVEAPVATVWSHVTTQTGINAELMPFLRMTMPKGFRGRSVADVAPGTQIGRSRLLLLGLIPIGHDDITIAQIEPGRMFREESAMTGMRRWVHHRTLDPAEGGTIVTDAIEFEPGGLAALLPGSGALMRSTLSAMFAHRHRRLQRRFA